MKRHYSLTLAAMLGLGLLGTGCHNDNNGGGGGGGTGGAGKTQLAFVTNNASDYWTVCNKGVDASAAELKNVSVQFVMPADGTAATQKQDVDDLVAKGVKGIAISPVAPEDQTTFLNDVASKAKLITSDSDAPKSNRLCYIGTDNHAAGVMAGGLIKEAIPQGGKIMLFVGKKDAQNSKDRIGGIQDALKGSNITILDVRTDDADHARAKANAADALVKNPDLACLVGIWSYNGPQIYNAVKEAGKIGKVKIVAFDQEDQTIAGIRAGAIYAAVVQDPYQFGYKSIQLLDELTKGNMSMIPANKMIIIPTQAIKKDNVETYMTDFNKKLGKA